MKNKLILLSVILLLTAVLAEAQSQRGVRIGYIDMEYILENVPEYQQANIQLDGKVQRWKKDIENQQKEIDQLKMDLSAERVLLTNELIEEREEDIKILEDKLSDYQQGRFGPTGDLVIQKRQLVQPIQDQVFNAVQEIAGNRQYDFIFDKSADVVMLYAAERNDISDQVVRIINRTAQRSQAESRKDKREIEQRDGLTDEQDKVLSEREQKIEDRKNEREALLEERRRVRDSIKDARLAEFEARRQGIIDQRNQEQQEDNEDDGENKSNAEEDKEEEVKSTVKNENETTSSPQEIANERKKIQDSIQNARRAEQEARRIQLQEERQQRRDSILNARQNRNTPPGSPSNENNGDED